MLFATLLANNKCVGEQMLFATLLANNKCVGEQITRTYLNGRFFIYIINKKWKKYLQTLVLVA